MNARRAGRLYGLAATFVVAAGVATGTRAGAQSLDSRVARASGDVVQFHYAARQGVCGDGRGLLRIDGGFWTTTYGSYSDLSACAAGPVRALITKDHNEVIRIQVVAGPLAPVANATDLGAVAGAEAGRYFLDLAQRLEGPRFFFLFCGDLSFLHSHFILPTPIFFSDPSVPA